MVVSVSAIRQKEVLKIVHPGRYVQIFRQPITAGEIMRKYPRHCITRPDVFQFPWIVVRPQSILLPGKVFYLVPYTTLDKLLKSKKPQLQSILSYEQESLYKLEFYESWNNMRENLDQPYPGIYPPFDDMARSIRPRVTNPDCVDLFRTRSCLRKPDNDRKELNLKVDFASPVVIHLGLKK